MAQPLILASSSPRRRSLLNSLGVSFTVDVADVDECARPGETPGELVERLSRDKAQAVVERQPGAVVLAADTVVVLDGTILGKPADAAEARSMLSKLGGRAHEVFTAATVARDGRLATRLCRSQVWMRPYSEAEIDAYVATGDPLDKAGAYAIQHPVFSPVASWEGCYTGIMGLPLGVAAALLVEAGVEVPVDVAADCELVSGHCCMRPSGTGCREGQGELDRPESDR